MTAFVIALAVGSVVGVVYIALAVRDIRRLRTAGAEPVGEVGGSDGFTWKAGIGVALSVLLLVGISISQAVWYVLPFLAIGSSIAVIVAFLEEA